jgi:hypothetical protein
MEEMLDDTMDILDEEDLEEEADAEVDKVLFELTDGKLGQAGPVGTDLPVGTVLCLLSTSADRSRQRQRARRSPKQRCSACSARCRSCSMGRERVRALEHPSLSFPLYHVPPSVMYHHVHFYHATIHMSVMLV